LGEERAAKKQSATVVELGVLHAEAIRRLAILP
jgi:hypothetical protein